MAFRLPRSIVISSRDYSGRGNFFYREADGFVVLGEPSVFSTLVKIEVERATKVENDKYVHLRFVHSNRYWQMQENGYSIACVSTKPEEDTSKRSCTLFEPVEVPNGMFCLNHVHTGGRLLINPNAAMSLYVNLNPNDSAGYMTFVDAATLVKLPQRVAFKGDNDRYLQGATLDRLPYLQFSSDNWNTRSSGHEVILMPDGHVRIKSDHFDQLWRLMPNWIRAEAGDTSVTNREILFWPVRIDAETIALRSAGNDRFIKRLTADRKDSCLNAADERITRFSELVVRELVWDRRILNVRYMMNDARIFDEVPFLAGSARLINNKSVEATLAVTVSYEEEESYSFSRSLSLTAGVATTITAGVPLIAGTSIEVSYEISTALEWENTTTRKKSATGSTSVPVPPMSSAVVTYVGTRGACSIPFHYTQQDTIAADHRIVNTEMYDGIYTGVSMYNFQFEIDRIESLASEEPSVSS